MMSKNPPEVAGNVGFSSPNSDDKSIPYSSIRSFNFAARSGATLSIKGTSASFELLLLFSHISDISRSISFKV